MTHMRAYEAGKLLARRQDVAPLMKEWQVLVVVRRGASDEEVRENGKKRLALEKLIEDLASEERARLPKREQLAFTNGLYHGSRELLQQRAPHGMAPHR